VNAATDAIAKGTWSPSLAGSAARIQEIELRLWTARAKRDGKKGLWGVIGGYIEYGVDWVSIKSDLSSARAALVQQVTSAWRTEGMSYPANARSILESIDNATSQMLAIDGEINRLTALDRVQSLALDQASAALHQAEVARSTSEQRYYGLGAA
jgi:hypothetical protein